MCMERTIIIVTPKSTESPSEKYTKKAAYAALESKDAIAFENILKETKLSPEGQEDILMKVIAQKDNESLACCLRYGFNPEGRGRDSNYLYNPLEACVHRNNAQGVKMLLQTNRYNVHKVKSSFEYAQRLKHEDCVQEFKK